MKNKHYSSTMAGVAFIASLAVIAGLYITHRNSKSVDVSSSQADIIVTDELTTAEESSLNESSLKENSEMPESRASDSSSKLCNSSEVQKIEQIAVTYTETNSNQNYFEPEIINETQPELGAPIEENTPTIIEDSPTELGEPVTDAVYNPYDLYNQGRIYYGDYQYTWYSERVLPGYGLAIDGRHTDADGFVCDGDGYICVASSSLNKGTVVDTPFGRQGKVYDSGCDWGTIDVYVNW